MKKSLIILLLILGAHSEAFGQWVQTNGPIGGQVSSLFSNDQNLIAGSTNGYVFLSTDSGNSWKDVGFADTAVYAVAGNGNLIFAATKAGVFRSSNNGIQWVPINSGLPDSAAVNSFGVLGSFLFEAGDGIFLSTDSGTTWKDATANLGHLTTNEGPIIGALNAKLFVGTSAGIFLSGDSGKSWSAASGSLISFRGFTQSHIIAMGNNLIAQDNDGFIYFSTDSGKSWQGRGSISNGYQLDQPIAIGSTLYAGATDHSFYSSVDTGTHWSEVSYTASALYLNLTISSMVSYGTNLIGVDENNSGLFHSTDTGKTWANNGPPNSAMSIMTVIDTNLFAGDYQATDLGTNWKPDANLATVSAFLVNGSDLFAATGLMLFSTNSGASWISHNYDAWFGAPNYVTCLAAIGSNLFAGTDMGGIFRTTDKGEDWTVVDDAQNNVTALGVIGTKLFAGTYLFSGETQVLETTDFGNSWSLVNINVSGYVNAFAVNGLNFFAGTDHGIFLSTDSGISWSTVDSGLPPESDIQAFAEIDRNVFASVCGYIDGIKVGRVYLSTNNGTSWRNVSEGLPFYQISALAVMDSNLFASTAGSGVWRRPLSEMIPTPSFVETQAPIQSSISAYPNPLSQSTAIRFTSAESGVARVTVVNLLGEEVARVFEGALTAGEHSFVWSKPIGLPAGMYECVVEMNGNTQQVPMAVTH